MLIDVMRIKIAVIQRDKVQQPKTGGVFEIGFNRVQISFTLNSHKANRHEIN